MLDIMPACMIACVGDCDSSQGLIQRLTVVIQPCVCRTVWVVGLQLSPRQQSARAQPQPHRWPLSHWPRACVPLQANVTKGQQGGPGCSHACLKSPSGWLFVCITHTPSHVCTLAPCLYAAHTAQRLSRPGCCGVPGQYLLPLLPSAAMWLFTYVSNCGDPYMGLGRLPGLM
jgi:hypothetical protein